VPDLANLITEVVDTMSVREREVQDLQGRWYSLRIRPYRTVDNKIDGTVMMFIDIDAARRIHLELQREQSFTAAVLESAAALVMVTDLEGRIVRFNLACRRLSGYSFEEVEGKPFWDVLVPREEIEAVKQVYKEALESRSVREHENHWVDRSGQLHLISGSSISVAEAQGAIRYLVRVGVDVTKARLAEKALQQGESRPACRRPRRRSGGGSRRNSTMTSARGWRRCPFRWRCCIRRAESLLRNCKANWGNCRNRWKYYRRISVALPATCTPLR
jgi:PAS domain S-box-containing protein